MTLLITVPPSHASIPTSHHCFVLGLPLVRSPTLRLSIFLTYTAEKVTMRYQKQNSLEGEIRTRWELLMCSRFDANCYAAGGIDLCPLRMLTFSHTRQNQDTHSVPNIGLILPLPVLQVFHLLSTVNTCRASPVFHLRRQSGSTQAIHTSAHAEA